MKRAWWEWVREGIVIVGGAYAIMSCVAVALVFLGSIMSGSPVVHINLNGFGEWAWETAVLMGVALPCTIFWTAMWVKKDLAAQKARREARAEERSC